MAESTRYRWNGREFVDITGSPEIDLLVADSFAVIDGGVVALDAHIERFSRSTMAQGMLFPSRSYIDAFLALIPRTGEWFPRIDFTSRGEIECRIRPRPTSPTSVRLVTAPDDPRTQPEIKGPDIPALNELRERARELGADDAVIVTPTEHANAGSIVDGATTCLIWWRDDVLAVPPPEARRVDSITVGVTYEIARQRGVSVTHEWAQPASLAGSDVWALNALHGIRDVVSWIDGPALGRDSHRIESWRADYERAREALPS